MELGTKLKELRLANHLSQEQAAEKLHVTRQAIARWENNKDTPSLMTLIEIADAYAVEISELFKSDAYQTATKIDTNIKHSKWYRFGFWLIISVVTAFLITLSMGRYFQIGLIDRFNPFLPMKTSYATGPKHWSTPGKQFATEAISDPFGENTEIVSVTMGLIDSPHKDNIIVLQHRGSYVKASRWIDLTDVPKPISANISKTYHKPNHRTYQIMRHSSPFS